MMVLGVDPGLTTGWCLQNDNDELESGQTHFDQIVQWIAALDFDDNVKYVVIEDFALLRGKAIAQSGSKFETCQVIGMFRLWAYQMGLTVVLQPPGIKPIAKKYSGIRVPSDHSLSHRVDAQLHAIYYLRQQGHYKTLLEREGL